MARNPFAAGSTLDALQGGTDYVNDFVDRTRRLRAGYSAGPKIAQGDYQGAAADFGAQGMPDEARTLMGDARGVEQQQYQRGRDATQDQRRSAEFDLEQAKERLSVLKTVTAGLRGVPQGQRKAQLDRIMPVFEQLKIDTKPFSSLTEADLTDQNLGVFDGQLDEQWQVIATQGGGVEAINKRNPRESIEVRKPDKPVVLGNGATLMGQDGRPVYTNPKTFAPPRAGSAKPGAFVPKPTGRSY
jgi:hypothetical protein